MVEEPDDRNTPGDQGPSPTGAGKGKSLPIRPELRNWRVVDVDDANARKVPPNLPPPLATDETIEGEAVVLDDAARTVLGDPHTGDLDEGIVIDEAMASVGAGRAVSNEAGGAPHTGPLVTASSTASSMPSSMGEQEDRIDSVLIAGLPDPELTLEPGSSTTLIVSLLNNGPSPAVFDIGLEGWVRESWLPPGGVHVPVLPGERVAATIAITPVRHPTTVAGQFPFYVVVRSPQYPRRVTRLRGTLLIRPYTDFTVGKLMPGAASVHPLRRRALYTLAVSNMSNHPLSLMLKGQGIGLDVNFDFNDDPGQPWQKGPAVVELAPGAGLELFMRAQVKSGPIFSTRPVTAAVRVVGSVVDELRPPRSANAELIYHSLIRPWHLALAVATSLLLLIASGTMAIAARFLLDSTAFSPNARANPVPTPAPVVIVLNQEAPQTDETLPSASGPPAQMTGGEQGPSTVDGLPVVRADQVTSPGQARSGQQAPVSATSMASGSQRTYAQMFQEIALQYDLDWRMLAAQAYEESGFDPLALGDDGDMGLMQVMPPTWREWAPKVGVSDPFDAYSNTMVAAAYLDHVRGLMGQQGKPQAQWMLVAYNWGPDKLGDFIAGGGVWDDLPAERARYAMDIMSIARTIP